jgi:lipopolysaccharide transport system ATP-binding protein
MSSDSIAISVRGISKKYRIGTAPPPSTLAERVATAVSRVGRSSPSRDFWALRDLEFDVPAGEVLGLLGRNGAGKSTLLKILARITEPTHGTATLRGRVGSLLEVGTGFHQELTGRENIFLNGAILGMKHSEVRRHFDAIVAFSGVSEFLDTPVKRYSSGMFVRLAFAVAAHLETEILLVDEVLAVGDAEFQRKCLGKMKELSRSGRTVIFVSHHMHSVALLCTSAAFLERGRLVLKGSVQATIERYSATFEALDSAGVAPEARRGTGEYRFESIYPARTSVRANEVIRFHWRIGQRRGALTRFYLSGFVTDELGTKIAQFDSRLVDRWYSDAMAHEGELVVRGPWLKPGRYRLTVCVCTPSGIVDWFEDACTFEVSPVLPYPASASSDSLAACLVLADYEWR